MINVIILKPQCVEVNQLESLVQKVQDCILLLIMFSKQELQSIKRREVSVAVFHDKFVHVVQCYSIKCKKRNHNNFVTRAKLLGSGDIELNLGPFTQGNKLNNLNELLQSRLAQNGLRIVDISGAGECFFRVVYH